MLDFSDFIRNSDSYQKISNAYRLDEANCLQTLIKEATFSEETQDKIQDKARQLVHKIRKRRWERDGIDGFFHTYDLCSKEGVALMCLAEALLRVPDKKVKDELILDKIQSKNWGKYLNKNHFTLINLATCGLMVANWILNEKEELPYWLQKMRSGIRSIARPIIRIVCIQAMKMLGRQFVMGQTIESALQRATLHEARGYRYSYDMLGEAAKTARDAEDYFYSYKTAIQKIAKMNGRLGPIAGAGVSVKLSALHPRYEWIKQKRVINELFPKLKELALDAKKYDIGLTIDAEEAQRLDLSLMLIQMLISDPELEGWEGLGLAVQSYQKRASFVIDWLIEVARAHKRRLMVRLVKGAYWDSEIKWAQEWGFSGYPVFTRKVSTDVCYLACAKKLLAATDVIYPQFATHNAYTVAAVLELAKDFRDFEFQCLQGMGDALYDNIVTDERLNVRCRVYAPVGDYEHLLAYLVRRLLENGANNSFVNRILDEETDIQDLITDPVAKLKVFKEMPHPLIPLPSQLYEQERVNSKGLDLNNCMETIPMLDKINYFLATALNRSIPHSTLQELDKILASATFAASLWDNTPVEIRANCLEKMAELLEENKAELMALLIREGGKTIQDANSEVREAVDFCRYYSYRCKEEFRVKMLPGPTGEHNQLELHGRGVIACISPWNFPLAIFLGQITAALAAGNTVVAKPASQTVLIAAKAIALLHEAGIPKEAVQLLIGSGNEIGDSLVSDLRVQGIMFTGSTQTARHINQLLAAREGAIIPLIAETGGQNAMIVDSSALTEQIITDVITSAFNSAGQRCSALRVLFVQEEILSRVLTMLAGAMAELCIGDPIDLETDIGPVIDEKAENNLQRHVERMQKEAKLIYQCNLKGNLPKLPRGVFFAPRAYQISNIKQLTEEVFGPILHIIPYRSTELDKVIQDINSTGYGLTLGIHSRIDKTVDYIRSKVRVGNTYVNRNMIGAVVGVQPFGGEGLSGTGPKAGGPSILPRLAVERTVSINTAASGGNIQLMSLQE